MTLTHNPYQERCEDYLLIEKALHFIEENYLRQPDLKEISASCGMSEFHFQRIFTRWAGISPKRFLQFLTKESAKNLLKHSSVLDATYRVGLSSPGRLHDLFVNTEAITPGEFKNNGAGLTIRYGFHPTPFGQALIGITARGICHLSFVQDTPANALGSLLANWNQAHFHEDPAATASLIDPIFAPGANQAPLSLFITGTNFQLKVWEALLTIPSGSVSTYQQIATHLGLPGAARAVGTAISHNPIAYLIPCHRVIRKMGEFGQYRWGSTRKKALLGWETTRELAAAQPLPVELS